MFSPIHRTRRSEGNTLGMRKCCSTLDKQTKGTMKIICRLLSTHKERKDLFNKMLNSICVLWQAGEHLVSSHNISLSFRISALLTIIAEHPGTNFPFFTQSQFNLILISTRIIMIYENVIFGK